jgi:hypothetical protein
MLLNRTILQRLDQLLTPKQRSRYCLLFGARVLAEFDSLQEAQKAKIEDFKFVSTTLYIPDWTQLGQKGEMEEDASGEKDE